MRGIYELETLRDSSGNAVVVTGATVTVRKESDGLIAQIYNAVSGGSLLANPFNIVGSTIKFYAEQDERYRIDITSGLLARTIRYQSVSIDTVTVKAEAATASAGQVTDHNADDEAHGMSASGRAVLRGTPADGRAALELGNSATLDVGVLGGTVCEGNDARLSDARTPVTHAGTHAAGGVDELTPGAIGAEPYRKRTIAIVDPTVNNDTTEGYTVWSLWANSATSEVFRCIDATTGAAEWVKTTLTIDELGGAALANIGTATGEVIGTDEAREYFGLEYEPTVLPTISSDFSRNKHELYEQYGNEPKTILQTWTTARATTGTYRDAAGVIRTAGIDEPRIDYDPVTGRGALLVEGARTNLLTYSEQFDNAAWNKTRASITANAIIAPDGTLTADTMDETATTGVHFVRQTTTVVANTTHTETIFVKYKSGGIERVRLDIADDTNTSNTVFVNYNLLTDAVSAHNAGAGSGAVVSFTKYNDGWVRIRISGIFNTVGTSASCILYAYGPDNVSLNYEGSTSRGIYIWGAQLEAASTPSSYIPTVASQVTRSADNVTRVLGSEFNASEGTILLDVTAHITNSTRVAISLYSGATQLLSVRMPQVDGTSIRLFYDGAFSPAGQVTFTPGVSKKLAIRWKDGIARVQSGASFTEVNTGNSIAPTSMILSALTGSVSVLNGKTKMLKYIPRALSAAELQEMTKP